MPNRFLHPLLSSRNRANFCQTLDKHFANSRKIGEREEKREKKEKQLRRTGGKKREKEKQFDLGRRRGLRYDVADDEGSLDLGLLLRLHM